MPTFFLIWAVVPGLIRQGADLSAEAAASARSNASNGSAGCCVAIVAPLHSRLTRRTPTNTIGRRRKWTARGRRTVVAQGLNSWARSQPTRDSPQVGRRPADEIDELREESPAGPEGGLSLSPRP